MLGSQLVKNQKFLAICSLIGLALPSIVTILTLSGGPFFNLGKVAAVALLFCTLFLISSTMIGVLKESRVAFLVMIVALVAFCSFLLANYSPVVYGGQDPAYYTAFSRVLSSSLGSPFVSSPFELTSEGTLTTTSSGSLPSTLTSGGTTEIQFYPMLPALMASVEFLFGDFNYLVVSVISALVVVAVILRGLERTPVMVKVLLASLWLFMPATIWFSRTPSSEIVSVAILALALLPRPIRAQGSAQVFWAIAFFALALLLARANPLLLILLIIAWEFHSRLRIQNAATKTRILVIAGSSSLAALFGLWVYWRYMPDFLEVIFFAIYGPHLEIAALMAGSVALFSIVSFHYLNRRGVNRRQAIFESSRRKINISLTSIAVLLLVTTTLIVMFSDDWGVYTTSQFGIGPSLVERFYSTSAAFLATSFGLSVLLLKVKYDSLHSMFLLGLVASLVFALVRNPGIPISYFYERYWWAEISLIILLLIGNSLIFQNGQNTAPKWVARVLIFSSVLNVIVFDRTIIEATEGGSQAAFKTIVRELRTQGDNEIYFSKEDDIWWLSQIVVPLRYSFGVRITELEPPNSNLPSHALLIASKPCALPLEYVTIPMEIYRLGKYVGLVQGWVNYTQYVYICKLPRS
jgi:hypothetical protein